MKTKLFYGNQFKYINLDSRWKKAKAFSKRVLAVSGSLSVIGWAVYAGANYIPRTVYADKEVVRIVEATTTAPVLDRIMKCESTASQHDKTGQVVVHVNKDGSYDMGIMQINSVWNGTAAKMGYDLSVEADNRAFGMWLFLNKGTGPWESSRACWGR